MADKLTLTSFGSLQQDSSATADLNANNAAIVTAVNNTLSRDGTAPNQMGANLDMNSNRILNLAEPENGSEPLRLQDAALLNGGGTLPVQAMPTGGTVGQALTKNSSTNYDASWITPSFSLSPGQVTSVNIATNTVTNANLNQAFPATLKGNPTAITANEQDFSIASLTDIVTPNTTNDWMLIQDSVSGTLKKVNTNEISNVLTAGVSSIDGKVGAFTSTNGLETSGNNIQISAARRTNPTVQTFTSGTSLTYNTPTNCVFIKVKMVGGGGGGGGNGNPAGSGGVTGGQTAFNSIVASGGSAGATNNTTVAGTGGAGGSGGTGSATIRLPGSNGGTGVAFGGSGTASIGGNGGSSIWGSGSAGTLIAGANSSAVGSGGAGAGTAGATSVAAAGGGGGGEYVELWISNPAASYTYTVGVGGSGGGSGSGGSIGGSAQNGRIYVEEYYNS